MEGTATITSSDSEKDSSRDADTLIDAGNWTPGTDLSLTRALASSAARVSLRDHKTVSYPVRANSIPRVVAQAPVPTIPMCFT